MSINIIDTKRLHPSKAPLISVKPTREPTSTKPTREPVSARPTHELKSRHPTTKKTKSPTTGVKKTKSPITEHSHHPHAAEGSHTKSPAHSHPPHSGEKHTKVPTADISSSPSSEPIV